uniref:Alternative protein SLC8A3 n=1 Tax=Homo sapiens TaxID=9606 RepID=L8E9C0_HUMAN|nr:alternative protein SLC8A3 [Homo sapiens]
MMTMQASSLLNVILFMSVRVLVLWRSRFCGHQVPGVQSSSPLGQ